MKQVFYSFRAMAGMLLFVVIVASCSKQVNSVNHYTLSEVRGVLDSQVKCWSNGDIDGFMQGYEQSGDVRFITQKGVKNNWKQILDGYKKGYPGKDAMGNLQFDVKEVRWLDSSAGISQVIGQWRVSPWDKPNEIHQGLFSLVFHGTENGPRILVDCTW